MLQRKNYFWIAPFLGGVLSLIALLTPAAYLSMYNEEAYVWMWGLATVRYYDPDRFGYYMHTQFIENVNLLIISVICSIFIFILAVILIVSANLKRTGKKKFNDIKKGWYGLSILLITTTAAWMIIYEVFGYIETSQSWWTFMEPGFGVIGIFLGAMISIIGTAIANYQIRQKQRSGVPFIEKQRYKYPYSANQGTYKSQQVFTPKFYPMCGNEVAIRDSKFCIECGFELGKVK
jgi:hypothetical protein